MSTNQACNLQTLGYWLSVILLTVSTSALVAQSSVITRSDQIGEQNKSYRKTDSTESTRFFNDSMTLPINTCAIVDRIEQIGITNEINSHPDTRIRGTIALPAGKDNNKAFYTNIDIAANQGYRPPQRNIAKAEYFRIYLYTRDSDLHVVTQSIPPQFVPGDTVLLQKSGLLEVADCMRKPAPR